MYYLKQTLVFVDIVHYSNFRKHLFLAIVVFGVLIISVFSVSYFQNQNINVKSKNFETMKLAVLDGTKLKASAKCFKAHDRVANMINDVLSRMKKSESDIKAEYEKVRNDKNLTQKQRVKDIAKIEAKWANISAKYNAEVQSIKNTDFLLSSYIQKKLDYVIQMIAKSAKLNVILNKGTRDSISVFYNSKNIDITDLVIQKLDEILPDVNLKEIQND